VHDVEGENLIASDRLARCGKSEEIYMYLYVFEADLAIAETDYNPIDGFSNIRSRQNNLGLHK
jgi:hypothetical protein